MRVLITGATGFIGSSLVKHLIKLDYSVCAAVRHIPSSASSDIEYFECGDISTVTNWGSAFRDIDAVVHLAGRAHKISKNEVHDKDAFYRNNVQSSVKLFDAAATAKIKKFIYISSIKVNGENSGSCPYTAADVATPEDVYAQSKRETEQTLSRLTQEKEIALVIIRPPLVYGPGAKGNFALLQRAIESGLPLPLASIKNARSLVSVFNLCDFIETCLQSKAADNEIFLVSDGKDVSTPELIDLMAKVMHRHVKLFPFPIILLKLIAIIFGKRNMVQRLCGNLQVDIRKNQQLLNWTPPLTVEKGLAMSVMPR